MRTVMLALFALLFLALSSATMTLADTPLTPSWSLPIGVGIETTDIKYSSVFTATTYTPAIDSRIARTDRHGSTCSYCSGSPYWMSTSTMAGLHPAANDSTVAIEIDSNLENPEKMVYAEFKLSDQAAWLPTFKDDCQNGKITLVLTPKILGDPGIKSIHVRCYLEDGRKKKYRVSILPTVTTTKDTKNASIFQILVLHNSSLDKYPSFMMVWMFGMQKQWHFGGLPYDPALTSEVEYAFMRGQWDFVNHKIIPLTKGTEAPKVQIVTGPGKDGINGKAGTNGLNGKDGPAGKDGNNGTNGVNGTDGTNGTNGVSGTNGTNGVSAKDGTNGRVCDDVKDCKDGKDGKE